MENRRALMKESRYLSDTCEAAPFVFQDSLFLMECIRPAGGGGRNDYYIVIRNAQSDVKIAKFAVGYGLACVLVHNQAVYTFASRWENDTWNDVTLFRSEDLRKWSSGMAIRQSRREHIFNTSVCRAQDRFLMAYESDDPSYVPFTIKFAQSDDLNHWELVPGAIFAPDRYVACPCLRYNDGYHYMLYLEHLKPNWRFETYMTRSRDLRAWEPSPRNPLIYPEEGEDVNTSDPDLIEYDGRLYLYYSIGDQRTYSKLKRAIYPGTLKEFLDWCYPS